MLVRALGGDAEPPDPDAARLAFDRSLAEAPDGGDPVRLMLLEALGLR